MKKFDTPSLMDKSFAYAYQHCIPLVTTIEITQACNFACKHCYNFDRTNPMPQSLKENQLRPEEILRLIEELSQSGTLYINFTGGEPLLSPYLESYITHCRLHHLEPRVKSNGALITHDRAQSLKKAGLTSLDISLYGMKEETYLNFTRQQFGLKAVVQGIENALESGLEPQVNIILHRYNVNELSAMISYCENLQIPFQLSIEVTASYDGGKSSKDVEITKEQFSELLQGPYGHFFEYNNQEKNLQCSCARSVCGISSTGEVYPCIGAPLKSGNLREDSFKDIWANSHTLNQIRLLGKKDFLSCQTCDHIEFCQRSSGTTYINTGIYTGCDDKTLEQAEIRHQKAKMDLINF